MSAFLPLQRHVWWMMGGEGKCIEKNDGNGNWRQESPSLLLRAFDIISHSVIKKVLVRLHWWLSKMAHGDWSRTSFSLAIITALGDYSNDGFQFSKWRPDLLMFRSRKLSSFVLFSPIITSAILLKQSVTSGSVNIAIVTSTSPRWLFADIHVAFGD